MAGDASCGDARIVTALRAARESAPSSIVLPDGAVAAQHGRALELRDVEGRLLVRYEDGHAEIYAPRGDLRLHAPSGRVLLASGEDVRIEAARDVVQTAGRGVALGAPHVRLETARAEIDAKTVAVRSDLVAAVVERTEVTAAEIRTVAARVVAHAHHWELVADRTVQKSRDALREVAGLAEERVGRLRTWVARSFALTSRRTTMRSTEETSIDGKRILLG